MANPGQRDHVNEGLDALPEKLRAPRVSRYLAVYLRQFDDLESAIQFVITAFLTWEVFGQQRDFVLDTIGSWLDQPRPEGYDNAAYAFVLRARVRVRRSSGTLADVYRVANFLAQGADVRVFGLVPRIVLVYFVDLTLTDEQKALYEALLLDTVGDVDKLTVSYVTSATAFYDVGEYDAELYAP